MNLLLVVNILVAICSVLGILLLAHKKKSGFIIFFIVEACMFYIGLETKQYGILSMSVTYFFSNIYAYYCWSKDDIS